MNFVIALSYIIWYYQLHYKIIFYQLKDLSLCHIFVILVRQKFSNSIKLLLDNYKSGFEKELDRFFKKYQNFFYIYIFMKHKIKFCNLFKKFILKLNYSHFFGFWDAFECSNWMWTEKFSDVRNPLSDVISNSVFPRLNSIKVFWLGKTEFDLRKTEFEMTSFRGFLTSENFSVHIQLLHQNASQNPNKGIKKLIKFYI